MSVYRTIGPLVILGTGILCFILFMLPICLLSRLNANLADCLPRFGKRKLLVLILVTFQMNKIDLNILIHF